jgi:hypothetical protein
LGTRIEIDRQVSLGRVKHDRLISVLGTPLAVAPTSLESLRQHMTSTISTSTKFRSVLAERELDHLEKMLRLSRTQGPVPHLNGAYWTARLTFVQEHFDLVAEQAKRVKALLGVSATNDSMESKVGRGMRSWVA